jgi:glycosyltransferase involved in cell wall biosynthesis
VSRSKRQKILYIQYSNPGAYPPLQHSARILADNGAKVLLLGIVTTGTEALEFPTHKNIEVRRMRSCAPGIRQKIHYLLFCLWVAWTALSWRRKWLYASDVLASPIAWLLTFWPGLSVLYHEHDGPGLPSAALKPRLSAFMRLVFWTRHYLARRAVLCVLPNERRIEEFRKETCTARPLYCVWNCPSKTEARTVFTAGREPELVIFFHGSIVPSRLPLTVLRALRSCPRNIRFHFVGYETIGHRGYVEQIFDESRRLGIRERISYLGALPRAESLRACSRAHVGISLMPMRSEDSNMREMVGASNKPFDYLLCGLALLVSDLPDWEKMFVNPRYGRSCNPDDPDSIADALRWFLDHPEERERMGKTGRERVLREWNYESQFRPVQLYLNSSPLGLVQPGTI